MTTTGPETPPMILDPLRTTRRITEAYQRYLHTTFAPRRSDLRGEFGRTLAEHLRLTRGPFLEASPSYTPGVSIRRLVDEGVLSKGFESLDTEALPLERPLHLHQERAIRRAVGGRNLVVATGTGSGKTESFLVPIVNHLMREREAGTLNRPGVRALLLYPMNALANDQVKRLRSLLVNTPDITFGRYVGETLADRQRARNDFPVRFPGEPLLGNELLSREEMQATPPHILLTNYAMLEYLLLRPADTTLFDGPTGEYWRFVVMDEAHVYGGAQGTEVAMLLRRVRDRVVGSQPGRLQCFATSATLGNGEGDYPILVDFAESLFNESFEWDPTDPGRQDVVGAVRERLAVSSANYTLPDAAFEALQRAFRDGADAADLSAIAREFLDGSPTSTPGETPAAYLYRLLHQEQHVVELQTMLERGSQELDDVAATLFTGSGASSNAVAMIDLCVAARPSPDDAPLIPARYHFMVRSLEGGFVCLHPDHDSREPRLRLERHEECPSCRRNQRRSKCFELAVCRNCRSEYLVGKFEDANTVGDHLVHARDFDPQLRHLLLGETIDIDDEDEIALTPVRPGEDDGVAGTICSGCGAVGETESHPPGCTCEDPPRPQPLTILPPVGAGEVIHRCPSCATRSPGEVISRMLTGTNAPVAVIATELFQQIPPSTDPRQRRHIGEGRKLLTFSDSRQDAAFFAPYFERTYNRSLERRLISTAIDELTRDDEYPQTDELINRVRRIAEDHQVLNPDDTRLTNTTRAAEWVTSELIALDHRQSIEGTGVAQIDIALPRYAEAPRMLLDLGLDPTEATDLILMLLDTIRASGAIVPPENVDLKLERFAPRNMEIGLRRNGSENHVLSWIPTAALNRRVEILQKVSARRGISADPVEILEGLWEGLTNRDSDWSPLLVPINDKRKGLIHRLDSSRFEFRPLSESNKPGRCDTCNQIWWRTLDGVCPTWRCSGTVSPVEDLDALLANHYARLYRESQPIGISVEEHTANFTPHKAGAIQGDFVDGRINALSCSTTFELGVDVGEVQAVLMRNVPPAPANYVQRAGRAGRRADSAALVVTYAQRRSHDRYHFQHPRRLVDGYVAPPLITLDNPLIGRRHAHSVAFAAYERHVVDSGGSSHGTVADFFLADDTDEEDPNAKVGSDVPAYEDFIRWLSTRPSEVGDALTRILPPETAIDLGIADWRWVDDLVEWSEDNPGYGWLQRAADEVANDLEIIEDVIHDAVAKEHYGVANAHKRVRETLRRRALFGFLASRNVLPKYGFPVDVVELDVSRSGDPRAAELDLSRDLELGIIDYAPGAETVAAKALWQSIGLKTRPGQMWPTYTWKVCGDCGAFRQSIGRDQDLGECHVCGSIAQDGIKGGNFVLPIFGFIGAKSGEVKDNRPPRIAFSERYFGAVGNELPTELGLNPELSSHVPIRSALTKQGRINIISRGPRGRGFQVCEWCGFGQPASWTPRWKKRSTERPAHRDARRPEGMCNGPLRTVDLGHHLLTDVVEIAIDTDMDRSEALSVLYALLEGVEALGISREDIDGTIHVAAVDDAPHLIIHDRVPGGAGHAKRLAENLSAVARRGLLRVESCDCGIDTSCYACLRNYSNQVHHDELSRAAAIRVLTKVLYGRDADTTGREGDAGGSDRQDPFGLSDLLDTTTRRLVEPVLDAGLDDFVIGHEVGAQRWPLEIAWPATKVAIVKEDETDRDAWLESAGWSTLNATTTTPDELLAMLHAARTKVS